MTVSTAPMVDWPPALVKSIRATAVPLLSSIVARGYQPFPPPPIEAEYVVGSENRTPLGCAEAVDRLGTSVAGGIAVLCTTYVARCEASEFPAMAAPFIEQLKGIKESCPQTPVLFMMAIGCPTADRIEGGRRVAILQEMFAASDAEAFAAVLIHGSPKKVRGINAALDLARAAGVRGIVLVDDDTRMGERCLGRVVRHFVDRGCRGAVGATRISVPAAHWSARMQLAASAYLQPETPYPYAWCMVTELPILAGGFPERYGNDDGYIFFELLAPEHEDPLHLLTVLPDAVCWSSVGRTTAAATLARIRSRLLSHVILMADYSGKCRYYRRRMLFYGLWPIGEAPRGLGFRAAATKWVLKAIFCVWFCRLGLELFVRGLVDRPIRTGYNWKHSRRAIPSA